MATGDGWTYKYFVQTAGHAHDTPTHHWIFRQVFWARYAEWAVTTPLILLELCFLAGLNGSSIVIALVSDVIMVATGLFAALSHHRGSQSWGYYVVAWLAYIVVVYQLSIGGRRLAAARGTATARLFGAVGGFALVLWTLHLLVWALGDGSRRLSVDSEIVWYAVLDALFKPILGLWLVTSYSRSAESVSLDGFWSHGISSEGAVRLDDDDRA